MRQWRKDIEAEWYSRQRDWLDTSGQSRTTFEHGAHAPTYYDCDCDEDGWHSWPVRFVTFDRDLGVRRERGAMRVGFGTPAHLTK